jgi:hypothetical protein
MMRPPTARAAAPRTKPVKSLSFLRCVMAK